MAGTARGKSLRELSEGELEELAHRLAVELPDDDPLLMAVRERLRRVRRRRDRGSR